MNIEYFLIIFITTLLMSIIPIICVEVVGLIDKIAMQLRKPIEPIPYEDWMPDMMGKLGEGSNKYVQLLKKEKRI